MMQPDFVDQDDLIAALATLLKKKKRTPDHDRPRLATLEEGTVVQVMHLGPFSEKGPVIGDMFAFAEAEGYRLTGKHHEIYLSDLRRTPPEKLRTVLCQPLA